MLLKNEVGDTLAQVTAEDGNFGEPSLRRLHRMRTFR